MDKNDKSIIDNSDNNKVIIMGKTHKNKEE